MTLFEDAIRFAAERHSGQKRKMSDSPYILHPLEVASIVGTMTSDDETLAASVLHDTVEDAGVTFEEIEKRFGKRVSLLVMTETEEKRYERPAYETWKLRKEETLAILGNTKDISVKMMWLGDKLSNMRSFYRIHKKEGDAMWNHFNQKDPSMQKWYYTRIAEYLKDLSSYDAYEEFTALTAEVFAGVNDTEENDNL